MTATSAENALVAEAQANGEAQSQSWRDHAEQMQAAIAGSQVETADAGRTPDDGAVGWFGSPGVVTGVSPQPTSSPNITDPRDNSQSQP
jgi:hypothetical protein